MNPRPQEHQENPEVSAEQRGSNELIKPNPEGDTRKAWVCFGNGQGFRTDASSAVHNRSSGEISLASNL